MGRVDKYHKIVIGVENSSVSNLSTNFTHIITHIIRPLNIFIYKFKNTGFGKNIYNIFFTHDKNHNRFAQLPLADPVNVNNLLRFV